MFPFNLSLSVTLAATIGSLVGPLKLPDRLLSFLEHTSLVYAKEYS